MRASRLALGYDVQRPLGGVECECKDSRSVESTDEKMMRRHGEGCGRKEKVGREARKQLLVLTTRDGFQYPRTRLGLALAAPSCWL